MRYTGGILGGAFQIDPPFNSLLDTLTGTISGEKHKKRSAAEIKQTALKKFNRRQ